MKNRFLTLTTFAIAGLALTSCNTQSNQQAFVRTPAKAYVSAPNQTASNDANKFIQVNQPNATSLSQIETAAGGNMVDMNAQASMAAMSAQQPQMQVANPFSNIETAAGSNSYSTSTSGLPKSLTPEYQQNMLLQNMQPVR